jgi:two-component system, OmpR family, alkaline phosphatase synthesis response regulator PhoP
MSAPTVLVVDDEEYILRILSFAMRAEGWHVLTASNGDEALKQVEASPPDLMVLDLMMPVIDGYQVLKRLKSNPSTRGIAVIVLSAKGRDFDRDAAIELGADDYFTKPFSPQRLVERIQGMVATSGAG